MAEKPKKTQKLRARLPRGLEDRGPAAIAATRQMVEKIREVYERYGFEPVETPAMEFTDALGKFLPDQDRPNEGVFSFQDDDEQWISLRYDLTAPLARYVAENFDALPKPYRSYRAGYVYRNEKPGPGRFRQFMQFDADTVGSGSPAADAEMCMMAADTMEALGIESNQYVVKINNRKILDGVLVSVDLDGDDNAQRRLAVLRALDKYDRLGLEAVAELLGPGRTDASGDVTKGAGLRDWQIKPLLRFLRFGDIFSEIEQGVFEEEDIDIDTAFPNPFCDPPSTWDTNIADHGRLARKAIEWKDINPTGRRYDWSFNLDVLWRVALIFEMNETLAAGLNELAEMERVFQVAGYVETVPFSDAASGEVERIELDDVRISVDPSVVRGLEYYTGPILEVELTLDTKDEKGRPVRFGSVGGGGRYDGLVSRFRGEPVPATGFSIGVSRLQAALAMLGKLDTRPEFGPVVVTVFDSDRVGDYQKMVAQLRNALVDPEKPDGPRIRAELYLGNPKNMGNQLKYADRRNSPCVIIQGSNERANGKIQIKDLILGAGLTEIKDREEYLKKQAEAQYEVDQAKLVDAVREVLARHDVTWG
ncbi:histidine--tRNA ligase [Bradyrhizobium sp. McL0615]|uniref:histidine--tRNA ligase n=1 Tax=Bradyrhizobium sp. McL0615 TaxID=3415673 RepID=UPI003CEEA649